MNSDRTRSRSAFTEDLLQSFLAASAALIDVVMGDVQPGDDLVGRQLLQVGRLEHDPVVVVVDPGDRPGEQLAGAGDVELGSVRVAARLLAPECLGAEGARGALRGAAPSVDE